jgi:hypothetical protein
MTSIVPAVILLLGSALMTGCAAPADPGKPAETYRPDELVYRTGSRIPIRDKTPMTKEEKQKQTEESQRALQQMQTTGAGNPRIN